MKNEYCLIVINYPRPKDRALCVCPETYFDLNEVFKIRQNMEKGHGKYGYQYTVEEYDANKKFFDKDGYEQYRE